MLAIDSATDLDVTDALQRLERHRRTFLALGHKSLAYLIEQGAVVVDIYADCKAAGLNVSEWIPTNLGCSMNTARNYRRLYSNRERIHTLGVITPSAAYQLLAPSTPDAIADQLISSVEQGGKLTVEDVEQALRPARLLEAASIIGHSVLDAEGLTPKQRVTQLRSMTEIADEATERGVVTFDGEDLSLSSLFGDAIQEHTEQRQAEHVAASYAVDLLITARVQVNEGRVVLLVEDAPAELLERVDIAIPLLWRERVKEAA
jgi:hypothetical protein